MFSKFPGIKSSSKRAAASSTRQGNRDGSEQEEAQSPTSPRKAEFESHEASHSFPNPVTNIPPVLPPIPRVASQYGSHGSFSLGGLEKKFIGHGTEGQQNKSQGKTVQPPRAPTSDLPLRSDEPEARTKSYPRPFLGGGNFSRPLEAPPKPTASSTTQPNQFRSQTEPGKVSNVTKPSIYPRPPSREANTSRPPLRDGPRPPSQLRESFTAEIPMKEAPKPPAFIPSSAIPPPPVTAPPYPIASPPSIPPTTSRSESLSSSRTLASTRPSSSSGSSSAATAVPPTPLPAKQSTASSMFTRLNPMALLARRRSTQPDPPVLEPMVHNRNVVGSAIPDDFDPRIRGKVVHDFSAPRPTRYMSAQDLRSIANTRRPSDTSPIQGSSGGKIEPLVVGRGQKSPQDRSEPEKPHTPIFKEHFDEDIDGVWRFDKDDRRNQVTTSILNRMPPEQSQQPSSLPPFAKKFSEPSPSSTHSAQHLISPKAASKDFTDKRVSQSPSSPISGTSRLVQSPTSSAQYPPKQPTDQPQLESTTPPGSPPAEYEDGLPKENPEASTSEDVKLDESMFQPSGLPKHMKSNASRFSFDLAGVGSTAQEKLLEDRHRQKQAQRTRASTISANSIAETSDEYDYDNMDFDDGFEEEIPGVNDFDEDEYPGFGTVSEMTLGPPANNDDSSDNMDIHSPAGQVPLPTFTGQNTLGMHHNPSLPIGDISSTSFQPPSISFPGNPHGHPGGFDGQVQNELNDYEDDDDLYFDDGDIDIGEPREGTFDESVFDDDSDPVFGLPIRDQKQLAVVSDEAALGSSRQSTRPLSLDSGAAVANQAAATADTSRTSVIPPEKPLPAPKTSLVSRQAQLSNPNQGTGLTQDNLAAYHDALAMAANKAASEGRFDRRLSIDSAVEGPGIIEQPRVSFNEQEFGARMRPLSDDSGFKFDDDFDIEDDEFVAAANAEALENDDEGFYGREFGFYARSYDANEGQYINGGYFGPAGANIPKRSHSGRAGGQDPSLTPITERSEWSQRNSMISLAHGSYPNPGMHSQGLVQLADSLQHDDREDMSLSALMKLRRGAWGSATSLHSNGGSQHSSSPPRHALSSPPIPPSTSSSGIQFGGGAASIAGPSYTVSSPHGYVTSPSDTSVSGPITSPLLRVNTQDLVLSPTHPTSSGSETSPKRRNAVGKGHSRNSSGAESVSYFKEKDDDGGRWVMERRRTGEGGQIEVLGRQVVDGGRI